MNKPIIKGNTIIVPSNQEYLADVDSFLEGKLRGYEIEESVIADIAISVSELVNNAILHGNKAIEEKAVTVQIDHRNGAIRISVSDEGKGFDRDLVPSPISDENLLKEVGRGIFIVESLMDKVDFAITPDGTTITVTKNLG